MFSFMIQMIPMLTAAGADLELKSDMYQAPPIYAAAVFGYDYTVEALIEAGANPDAKDDMFKESAIIVAAQFGYKETVRLHAIVNMLTGKMMLIDSGS